MRKIYRIIIEWEDGQRMKLSRNDLQKIRVITEATNQLEFLVRRYEDLKRFLQAFNIEGKRK